MPRLDFPDDGMFAGDELNARLRLRLHQLGGALRQQVKRRRIRQRGLEPARLLASLRAPVDIGPGEEIRPYLIHERILTKGRCGRV